MPSPSPVDNDLHMAFEKHSFKVFHSVDPKGTEALDDYCASFLARSAILTIFMLAVVAAVLAAAGL